MSKGAGVGRKRWEEREGEKRWRGREKLKL